VEPTASGGGDLAHGAVLKREPGEPEQFKLFVGVGSRGSGGGGSGNDVDHHHRGYSGAEYNLGNGLLGHPPLCMVGRWRSFDLPVYG